MSVNLRWQIEGTEEVSKELNSWVTRLRDPTPAFDEMMDHLAAVEKDWFKTNAKPGGAWVPLSEPYRTWKRKKFPKRGILHGPDRKNHRGLQLRDQLTRRPFGFEVITRSGFELGTQGLDYARAHQMGLNGMPKREALKAIDQKTIGVIERILQMHVVGEVLSRNGR